MSSSISAFKTEFIKGGFRYVAFADETKYNEGRYRGIALVSLLESDAFDFGEEISRVLIESCVTELKWYKLRTAKHRFAALRVLRCAIEKACVGKVRVDVLIWDVLDRRHAINRRDDIANLHRMYFHILKNVLCERWPDGGIWQVFPDEHTSMDWVEVERHLLNASVGFEENQNLIPGWENLRFRQEFRIEKIKSCKSCDEPLIQVADLFAGLATFSCEKYEPYSKWLIEGSNQREMFEPLDQRKYGFSGSDRERFPVLLELDRLCKDKKLGVSLKTNRGLRTFDPKNPLNFWLYVPQHEKDRAPIKNRG